MGSEIDKQSMKTAGSDVEMAYNLALANQQREKTEFRAHKTALNTDQYNPARLSNAIQQKQFDN